MTEPGAASVDTTALVVTAPRRRLVVRPTIAFQAMLLLLVVGNLGRIPLVSTGDRSIPLLVNDIATLAVVAIGSVLALQRRSLELDAVALLGLLFAGIGGISAIAAQPRFGLSFGEIAIALAFLARWFAYFALYIVGVNVLRHEDRAGVWRALELCILLFAAFGIVQAAMLPDFARIVYPDAPDMWDYQKHRLVSTLLDPNYAGAFIAMGLLVELALMAMGERVALWKPSLLALAMVLTLSRGTLLAFAVGFAVILVVRGLTRRIVYLFGAAAAVLLLELPRLLAWARTFHKLGVTDASAQARLVSWLRGWTVFRDHPIIGIGFNAWGPVQARYGWEQIAGAQFGIEGGMLFVAVLTGVVGLAVFVAMLGYTIARSRAVWRDASLPAADRGIALGTAAVLVTICVHSLFTNTLFLPAIMAPMWVLCALVFAVARDAS